MKTLEQSSHENVVVRSPEDTAKELWLQFEAYSRGEIPAFRAYFVLGINEVHDHFAGFLQGGTTVTDIVAAYPYETVTLWRKADHYSNGTVCGYWYEAQTPDQPPQTISLLAATA